MYVPTVIAAFFAVAHTPDGIDVSISPKLRQLCNVPSDSLKHAIPLENIVPPLSNTDTEVFSMFVQLSIRTFSPPNPIMPPTYIVPEVDILQDKFPAFVDAIILSDPKNCEFAHIPPKTKAPGSEPCIVIFSSVMFTSFLQLITSFPAARYPTIPATVLTSVFDILISPPTVKF